MSPLERDPLISVVIPKRDRCELTLRALLSVFRQTYRSLEVIIVDDASTEDDRPLLDFIVDKPVRIIRIRRHCGAAEARNHGIKAATGEFIAFLDSDDYWLPNKIERQLDLIRKLDQPCLLAGALAYTKRGEIFQCGYPELKPGTAIEDYLYVEQGVMQTTTFMMPTDVARRVRFDETLPVHQDTDFLLRATALGVRVHFDGGIVGIADAGNAHPRITNNTHHLEDSMAWFKSRSVYWREATRRAFLRHDYSNRCGRSNRRLLGFRYYLASPMELPWSFRLEMRTLTLLLLGMPLMEFLRARTASIRSYLGLSRTRAAPEAYDCFHADAAEAKRLMAETRRRQD